MYMLRQVHPEITKVQVDYLVTYRERTEEGKPLGYNSYYQVNSSPYEARFHETITSLLHSRRGTIGDPWLGYDELKEGLPPENHFESATNKSSVSNGEAWRKRETTGRIVMSPMSTAQVDILYENSPKAMHWENSNNPGYTSSLDIGTVINGRWFLGLGRGIFVAARFRWACRDTVYTSVDPRDEGWDISAKEILRDLLSTSLPIDTGLVTETIAAANTGSMDLLTTAAELPETMKSIFDGIGVIGRLFKSASRKELKLSEVYNKKKQRIRDKYDRQLAAVDYARRGANKRKRIILARQEVALKKARSQAYVAEAKSFGDAVTSVWMNYRYNIMPNIYSIDDGLELLAAWHSDYVTSRQKDRMASYTFATPQGFGKPVDVDALNRCVIKRRYVLSGNLSTRLLQLGSANVAVTALELVKRSFVLGWFINLGEVLSAYTAIPVHDEQMSCYSDKIDFSHVFVGPSGSRVNVRISAYRREIINPRDHAGLAWKPEFTLFRAFDSAAMLWPSIKKNLIKGKHL